MKAYLEPNIDNMIQVKCAIDFSLSNIVPPFLYPHSKIYILESEMSKYDMWPDIF